MNITRAKIKTESGVFTDVIVNIGIRCKYREPSQVSYHGSIAGTKANGERIQQQLYFASRIGLREVLCNLKSASC